MQGYRFFAEMPDARKSKSASKAHPFSPWTVATLRDMAAKGLHVNCVAIMPETARVVASDICFDAVGAVFDYVNSGVSSVSPTRDYLRKRCVRVPEELARRLHPALFSSGLL